ncbi:MAG TPA: ABC transporter ATP-binding protein [Spirochaetota bacterium]|nr:ABC transporter ATP-binding protein [Spirochaetota bacterium]
MKRHEYPVLEVRDLRVVRGGAAILDVPGFTLAAGEVVAVIGPNGAGKTTLLSAVLGLQKSSGDGMVARGSLRFPGTPPHVYRRGFSMVFQDPLLFNTTVYDNVASGLRFRGASRRDIDRIVSGQLERFGIASLRGRKARSLSGGEARRVSLARAFATDPEILLLDEPFASLDAPARESILEDLEKALAGSRTAALLVTHDRVEALRLADSIIALDKGRILQSGATIDVLRRPASEFVASFAGTETVVEGRVVRSGGGIVVVSASGVEIEAAGEAHGGQRVALCIRPENIVIATVNRARTSARNAFTGRVVRLIPMPHYHKVVIDCGFTLVAYITHHSIEEMGLCEGGRINASFKATAVHLIKKER